MSEQQSAPGPEPQLLVGIDWATKTHVGCALAPDGKKPHWLEFPHSVEGFGRLRDWLLELCPEPTAIAVAIEDPHHPLVDWLLDQQLQLFAINPKQLSRFRDRHSVAGAKDDRRDAYVAADALRTDRHKFTALVLPNPTQLAIREASRRYDTLEKEFNRETNRLQALLLRAAPKLLELCPGGNEPFFFELLELAPSAEAARRLRPARVTAVLRKHDKRKFAAAEVLTVLRAPRLPLAPGAQEAITETIATLLPVLFVIWEQMAVARRRLRELSAQGGRTAEIIDSFPGAAEVVTCSFLAEASPALAARDYQRLRGLAGTAPVTVRSGKTTLVGMRRACNRRLKHATSCWARSAIVWDPVAKEHYWRLKAKGHRQSRALRGVADRLLGRLIAALASDSLYRPPPSPEQAGTRAVPVVEGGSAALAGVGGQRDS